MVGDVDGLVGGDVAVNDLLVGLIFFPEWLGRYSQKWRIFS